MPPEGYREMNRFDDYVQDSPVPSGVPGQIFRFRDLIDRFENAIDSLHKRVEPLLRPEESAKAVLEQVPTGPRSALTMQLTEANDSFEQRLTHLQMLIGRLDLG